MIRKSTIKFIQSLQQKKNRDEHKLFIAEGPKLVNELLTEGSFVCQQIFIDQNSTECLTPQNQFTYADRIESVQDFELQKMSGFTHANKILALFEQRQLNTEPDLKGKISLVLDDIRDPGNLGTIIRIADWFGIENLICSLHTADPYNPKVVQGTMASLGRVKLFYKDLPAWLPKISVKKFAATLGGKPLTEINILQEAILVIGNESFGVSEPILQCVDENISIPGFGKAESLNAAVATGIILYHFKSRG